MKALLAVLALALPAAAGAQTFNDPFIGYGKRRLFAMDTLRRK